MGSASIFHAAFTTNSAPCLTETRPIRNMVRFVKISVHLCLDATYGQVQGNVPRTERSHTPTTDGADLSTNPESPISGLCSDRVFLFQCKALDQRNEAKKGGDSYGLS